MTLQTCPTHCCSSTLAHAPKQHGPRLVGYRLAEFAGTSPATALATTTNKRWANQRPLASCYASIATEHVPIRLLLQEEEIGAETRNPLT